MTNLYIYNNQFTSSIPSSIYNLYNLTAFSANNNNLSSSISKDIGYLTKLYNLNLENNALTGILPTEIFSNCTRLQLLSLSNNLLSGSIPSSISNLKSLRELSLSGNQLRFNIPSEIGYLSKLVQLDLSVNRFDSTVPSSLTNLKNLQLLLLQQNALTGPIEQFLNPLNHTSLTTIDISNNQFAGSIPSSILTADWASLNSLTMGINCFIGIIPDGFCSIQTLKNLHLDGLHTSIACRDNLIEGSTNDGSDGTYTSRSGARIEGSFPGCLLTMPMLQVLHLSGNGLTGTLPDNFYGKALTTLSASNNLFKGSIPDSLYDIQWNKLDLSVNYLNGRLSDKLKVNSTLYLKDNRLSGRVPQSIHLVPHIRILDGNLFACRDSSRQQSLPLYDPLLSSYQCGSNSFNDTLYTWIVSFSIVCACVLMGWHVQRHRMKTEEYIPSKGDNSICERIKSRIHIRRNQFIAFVRFYVIIFQDWTAIFDGTLFTARDTPPPPTKNIIEAGKTLHNLRIACLWIVAFAIFFLTPIMAGISSPFGTYSG